MIFSASANSSSFHATRRGRAKYSRSGFSFVEVLFSVIILGIGFIMVAAIFPVAIAQSKQNTEETMAAELARGAASVVQRVFESSDYNDPTLLPLLPATGTPLAPYTGSVVPIPVWTAAGPPALSKAWQRLRGDLTIPADPRFAFVLMYRRDGNPAVPSTWSPFAQIYIVTCESRLTTGFDFESISPSRLPIPTPPANTAPPTPNLSPRSVAVTIYNAANEGEPDTIAIQDLVRPTAGDAAIAYGGANAPFVMPFAHEAAATGAYVIIGNDIDPLTGKPPRSIVGNLGRMNGKIYRLGNLVSEEVGVGSTWELSPDGEFSPDPGADNILNGAIADDIYQPPASAGRPAADSNTWQAWIVGKSFKGVTQSPAEGWRPYAASQYDGQAMDVSVFTTFVKVN